MIDLELTLLEHWRTLGAFAWTHRETCGPGVVLVTETDLSDAEDEPPELSYVPAAIIPSGDDFHPIIKQYDPTRQVLVMVQRADGSEQLIVLEPSDDRRPAPPDC